MSEQVTITVRDSVLYEPASEEQMMTLFFPRRTVTARELIRERVLQEVQSYNKSTTEKAFRGLISPTQTERLLNARPGQKQRLIDGEKQCELAMRAFAERFHSAGR